MENNSIAKWAPLHMHSSMGSLLDGFSQIPDLVNRCKELGYKSAALTDHGTLNSIVELFKECKKNNMKPLAGIELYVCDLPANQKDAQNRSLSHLVVICKNLKGWYELVKLVSLSNMPENYYYKPRVDYSMLKQYLGNGNHICITGHPGSTLADKLFKGDPYGCKTQEAAKLCLVDNWESVLSHEIDRHVEIFSDGFFGEIQLIDRDRLPMAQVLADCIRQTCKEKGLKTVATGDSHYVRKSDAVYQRILLCSSLNRTLPSIYADIRAGKDVPLGGFFLSDNYHIPSIEELEPLHTPEELANAVLISKICEDYDILSGPKLPRFECPDKMSESDFLRKLCDKGWNEQIANSPKDNEEYKARLDMELSLLIGASLSGYFLIVWDIVNYMRSRNWITPTGRGSAAGCLVSYLLGITSIDPIPYGLLMERFYDPSRAGSLPDIDLDVPSEHREEIIQYIKDKYGEKRVSQMATFGTLMGRSALKEVFRAEGEVSFNEVNEITEFIPDEAEIVDELENMEEKSIILWALQNRPKKFEKWVILNKDGSFSGPLAESFKRAVKLEGTHKSQGKHAAGIIISSDNLDEVCPMIRDREGKAVAGFSMGDLEALGHVKFDILGIDLMSKIMKITNYFKGNYKDFEDQATWDMLSSGDTKGVFQLEKQKRWTKKLKPRNIHHLAALLSVIRPGCIFEDTLITVKKYRNANGKMTTVRKPIKDLFKKQPKTIISLDESSNTFIDNNVKNIIYSGQKECFNIKIKRYSKSYKNIKNGFINLSCTDDHRILTSDGWKEAKDLCYGDRIVISSKKKNKPKKIKTHIKDRHFQKTLIKNCPGANWFDEICYQNYQMKCCICEYSKTSLDIHHIEGNRYTDNSPDNLCFLCPNCHREVGFGLVDKKELLHNRNKYRLYPNEDIEYATYIGKESIGIKNVYDISMDGPNHNFVAGEVVVHNCVEAIAEDGKSMTEHYIDRANEKEETPCIHAVIDKILHPTYSVLVYQEQAMFLARNVAGFNMVEANLLRKAIGKKLPELMAKLKIEFLDKSKSFGSVPYEVAEKIFDWIEKSQRYSFCAAHAYSYAENAFYSAYLKCHCPLKFYEVYLNHAKSKPDTIKEMKELINDAKMHGIEVLGPSLTNFNYKFTMNVDLNHIHFGISNIKEVGEEAHKLIELKEELGDKFKELSWIEVLIHTHIKKINKKAIKGLILCGALNGKNNKTSRAQMFHEYMIFKDLTDKEVTYICNNYEQSKNLSYHFDKLINNHKIAKNRLIKVKDLKTNIDKPPSSTKDTEFSISNDERNYMGISITNYEFLEEEFSIVTSTCLDVAMGRNLGHQTICGYISDVREHKIAKPESKLFGQKMAFVCLEDSSGEFKSIIAFPEIYNEYKSSLVKSNKIIVSGKVESRQGEYSLICDRIIQA